MDITGLKDYILSDEIKRIESLSREELVQEMIDLTAKRLDSLSDNELLNKLNNHEK